jgi:GDPmannose 4,6-dehydratase
MPRFLVLGVNGQDGSYLAESLLARGHEVVGIGRAPRSAYARPEPSFRYISADLRDAENLAAVVAEVAPDQAFHVAAIHGASGFAYETLWRDMMAVNVMALQVLLEHARVAAPNMRVVYAGSSKIFPPPLSGVIDEETPVRATCLYGIGKIVARDLMTYYRAEHGIRSTNLILFNHESPRRPPEYLLTTLARAIFAAKRDPEHHTLVRTLDFWIDWGAADEFMEIAADIAEKADEPEFVLASGKTWHGRAAAKHLFAMHGLDSERHLVETLAPGDPGPEFHVSLGRLEQAIGRKPQKDIGRIVNEMIAAMSVPA